MASVFRTAATTPGSFGERYGDFGRSPHHADSVLVETSALRRRPHGVLSDAGSDQGRWLYEAEASRHADRASGELERACADLGASVLSPRDLGASVPSAALATAATVAAQTAVAAQSARLDDA